MRPDILTAHQTMGEAAVVTRPGAEPIATTVIARPERSVETTGDLRLTGTVKPFGLRRDHVATAPQGTVIEVVSGPDAGRYSVDAVELDASDELRVLAVRL